MVELLGDIKIKNGPPVQAARRITNLLMDGLDYCTSSSTTNAACLIRPRMTMVIIPMMAISEKTKAVKVRGAIDFKAL
jgi:hypothetical protein